MTAAIYRGSSTGERVASLHCNRCEADWPVDFDEFQCCPTCEGRTWWMCAGVPLGMAEAVSLKRHADFERFYQAHLDFMDAQTILAYALSHVVPRV